MKAEEIFLAAVEERDPAQRAAYLNNACAGDDRLRAEVEGLLKSHEDAGSFLEQPVFDTAPTIDQPITEKPGTQIGPYKLLQQVGEGGMGVVYMAEQKEPVKRRVALKIIKPGMDTRQVIARFEAERQALAMMDHPNIAKVLDAGQTESGRPYFVMELVKGISVTQYCDEQHLTPKERLELFVPICQAVQHAHQKGIIHRDLKPSNVLVALYDGQAVPKVIDFGVAKATNQTLTEKTMFTQLGQVVGTLEYMSPEQAQVNQLDVDTRSDIYSLGVLLYELLTGDTPFDRQRLRSAAFDEMLRIIREEEPPKPSTKISSSEALPTVAANRHVDPQRLTSSVRGELDWIVMKALEKDRARRYETASKFAEDVQNYLDDEPVVACPPSWWYEWRKRIRKNRTAVVIASLVIMLLVAVTISALIVASGAQRLATQRVEANQRVSGALADSRQAMDRAERAGIGDQEAWLRAKREIERAQLLADNELVSEELKTTVRESVAALSWLEKDRTLLTRLERIRRELGGAISLSTQTFHTRGSGSPYRNVFSEYGLLHDDTQPADAAKTIATKDGEVREALVMGLDQWARYLRQGGTTGEPQKREREWAEQVLDIVDTDPWNRKLRRAIREKQFEALVEMANTTTLEEHAPHVLLVLGNELCRYGLVSAGEVRFGVRFLKKAQRIYPDDYWLAKSLAGHLGRLSGDEHRVEHEHYAAIAAALRPKQAMPLWGSALNRNGRYEEAIAVCRRAIQMDPKGDPSVYATLSAALNHLERRTEAVTILHRAMVLHENDPEWHQVIGQAYRRGDAPEEALVAYRKALDAARRLPPNARNRAYLYDDSLRRVIDILMELGRPEEALPLLDQLQVAIPEGKNSVRLARKGEVLVACRRWEEAAEAYRKLLKLEYQWWFNQAQLVRILAALDCPEEIDIAAATLIKRTPPFVNQGGFPPPFFYANRRVIEEAVVKSLSQVGEEIGRHHTLGYLQCRLRNYAQAIEHFRKVIQLDAQRPEANFNLAYCLAKQKLYEEAIPYYQQAISLGSDQAAIWKDLAYALQAEKRFGDAASAYRRTLEHEKEPGTNPQTSTILNLGMCLEQSGDYLAATESYREYLIIRPTDKQVHNRLGNCLRRVGDNHAAIDAYRKAIELSADGGGPHNNLGIALQAVGDEKGSLVAFRRAVEHFRAVLKQTPESKNAQSNLVVAAKNLADAIQKQAQDEAAVAELSKVIESGFPSPEKRSIADWGHLGHLLYRAGRYEEARHALEKVVKARGDDGPSLKGGLRWWYYMMTLWRVGERELANKYFDRLVEQLESNPPRNKAIHERLRAEAASLKGTEIKKARPPDK